jgi:transcriptional regulator with XRE-family HTH domain
MTPQELKAIRATLGLSQRELAQQLGVARNTVARWEIGIYPISDMAAKLIRSLRPKKHTPRKPKEVAMRSTIIIALLALLTACTQVPYGVKPGGTYEQLNADRFDCKQKVVMMYGGYGQMGIGGAMVAGDDYHECMRAKGYSQGTPTPAQPVTSASTQHTARP